jgi:amino acid transporter
MVIFAMVGFMFFQGDNFVPFMPFGFSGITLAVTLFFWSYTGFEAIVVPTGEVKNPSKNIPLAMILTLLITIVVYLLIAIAFVGMINWDGVHLSFKGWKEMTLLSSPLSDVSKALGLMWLAIVVSIGAIIGTGGSGGGWVLIQGRMPYAMAKDRLFWNSMARVHPKYGTPVNSLLFSSFLTTIILIAIPNFPSVALVATVTVLVPYAAAILSVPILRKVQPKTARPFKLPCVMTFSIIGFILATYLFYWGSWPWTLVGGLLVLTGYPAFLLVKEKESDWKKSLWVPVYILGIVIISFLGDPKFMFNNFLPWNPLGYLTMPYDLVILGIFAIIIFSWAYKENIKVRE